MRWIPNATAAGLMLVLAAVMPARAEVSDVKIAAQNGTNYLPLYVMQGNKLVEKHLAAKGLKDTTVTWARLGGATAIVDSILSGAIHFSANGVPSTALLVDRTKPGMRVKAVSALVAANIWFMTKRPGLKSLKDLTDKDRIALPSIKSSAQALMLWMAAEQQFGAGQWGKFDHIAVTMAHPEALAAVTKGVGDITVHAATSPYAEIERKAGLWPILDLFSVTNGPSTGLNFCSSEQFREANPKTYEAVVAAFNEAIEWVNADKKRAAEFYHESARDKLPIEDLTQIISDPGYIFSQTPRGIGAVLDMMHKGGVLKTKMASWKELYFAEAQKLDGN